MSLAPKGKRGEGPASCEQPLPIRPSLLRGLGANPLHLLSEIEWLADRADAALKNGWASKSEAELFVQRFLRIAQELVQVTQRHRSVMHPQERSAFRTIAICFMKLCSPREYYALSILRNLHEFDALRELQKNYHEGYLDALRISTTLEDHRAIFRFLKYEDLSAHLDGGYEHEHLLRELFQPLRKHIRAFASNRGFEKPQFYGECGTLSFLKTLSGQYDLAIGIAKGGLFSGALADVLGIPTRVIEVHAHGRMQPETRLVDAITREDVEGKRILLLDKDIVTGASIRETVAFLQPLRPAGIGVFTNLPLHPLISSSVISQIHSWGVALHDEHNTMPASFEEIFFQLHARLGTPLGRLEAIKRSFDELLRTESCFSAEEQEAIRLHLHRQEELFLGFNHLLPGMGQVRSRLVARLEGLLSLWRAYQEVGSSEQAAERMMRSMHAARPLPDDALEELAKGRYLAWGRRLAAERKVVNEHIPHHMTASFRSAQQAVRNRYDVALIVGPEGFAYEPIFQDLGMTTFAINIPEADFDGERTLTALHNLALLEGRRVLVVEDDVQSGATLRKLLEALVEHAPKALGLYLGTPIDYQRPEGIPAAFQKVFFTEPDASKDEVAFLRHLRKREVLLKRFLRPSPFTR